MVEFAILGPLEVRRGGRLVALGGPKSRAVLAALVVRDRPAGAALGLGGASVATKKSGNSPRG